MERGRPPDWPGGSYPHGRPPHPRPRRIAGRRWRTAAAHRPWPPGTDHWRGCNPGKVILLFDIGNTNTHLGLANSRRVVKQADVPTAAWLNGKAEQPLVKFTGGVRLEGAALCSVVPRVTPLVVRMARRLWHLPRSEEHTSELQSLRH